MNEEETTTTPTAATTETASPETVTPALFDDTDTDTAPATASPATNTPDTEHTEQPPATLTARDIQLPEGYEYEEELGNNFLAILNDEKLTRKELGQKLFDLYNAQGVKMLEALKAAEVERGKKFEADLAAEKAAWLKLCEADTEYGGQLWESSQAVIDRGCKQIATPEAVKLMQAYNLNTHPEIVRMFYRAGKLAGEDKSQVAGNSAVKEKDAAEIIFGESLKEYHKRRGENN